MREIKFRAWNITEKRFLTTEELIYRIGVEAKRQFILANNCLSFGKSDPSDEIIFQQYTGLTDRNGQEIYEGDYLWSTWSIGSHGGFVMFEEGRFFINIFGKMTIRKSDEIMGNIFEGVDE